MTQDMWTALAVIAATWIMVLATCECANRKRIKPRRVTQDTTCDHCGGPVGCCRRSWGHCDYVLKGNGL